ncbi:MAG: Panacea domain-containing protein [Tepidibacter sp.]|jgi:hypothetical protein|uniref:type II toxin-antitoxin system antitoxin SocA domain-containing protein n=1 Tax=Tepidibacter sp. TaxID=2529387 RepID=UPI0025E61A9D|nr:type II toxin-antitoxin system antitoxin SocA domain-containing protein [Tepidibacter sp.]MCT4507668.1 Panacea domain-containing protein [Tepidibacter sp.]
MVKLVEESIYDAISYKIIPNKEVCVSDFSLEEINVLEKVATTFKDYRSREIIDYMHGERAYKEREEYQIIPYSLAMELKELR